MKANINEALKILKAVSKDFTLLSKVGSNPPRYEKPSDMRQIIGQLEKIATVFKDNMTFNPHSPHAEEYALCLTQDGKFAEALKLFDLISEGQNDFNCLFTHNTSDHSRYPSEEVSPVQGKLGFEGAIQYAKLNLKKNRHRAIKLLMEIAEKIPPKCNPIHLQDVRVEAIEILQSEQISWLNGKPIAEELALAKHHQY